MESLGAGVISAILIAVAFCGGAVGFVIRRKQERELRAAHEAAVREQINAAGRARDRAREEAQEVEERFQRVKERSAEFETILAASRAELAALRARLADLEARSATGAVDPASLHAVGGQRERELEQVIEQLQARLEVTERQRAESAPGWLLTAPLGHKDDLKAIRGLGPVLERDLNKLGIFHFHQLARMTARDIHWIAGRISAFPGLNKRYRWADQARGMVARPTGRHGRNGGNGRSAASEKPRDESL